MENCTKVFSSNITIAENHHKNNLYDLFNIVPAKPLKLDDIKKNCCSYSPKTDKYYTPKRKSKLKVKTVRDIRKSFEQDIYSHLFTDLETQQNILLKKIRFGSSRDDNTTVLAKKILRGDTPVSRPTWQMLINLNPEHHTYPRQFVLWHGKNIQVNGTLGGKNKFICNHDLAYKKLPSQNNNKKPSRQNAFNKKKGLLLNSLAVKFKPGPLSKKRYLDDSHQKYHVGNVELINLPKPGLDIQPTYGTALESSITLFLNNLRKEDGTISRKWAELAVSVLGTVKKSNATQLNRDCVTFDLNYKYNQNRLLMRRDIDNCLNNTKSIKTGMEQTVMETIESNVLPEIEEMLDKMIDAVEINISQDKMFSEEQDLRQFFLEDLSSVDIVTHAKDKPKRRFCELDRLDVTVIRLPETEECYVTRNCGKMHCSFGCICDSLDCTYNLRRHCGRVECMFNCKCEFSKYKGDLSYIDCSDLIPGLMNLDNEINLKLAKEEQKFHQTVIVTGEKRILLKGEKRNWKTSKKYADFYSNMSLKSENRKKLGIVALKLNCNNIEPLCMVHNLYKCFCKGRFTQTWASNETLLKEPLTKDSNSNPEGLEKISIQMNNDGNDKERVSQRLRIDLPNSGKKSKIFEHFENKPNKTINTSRNLDKLTNFSKLPECLNNDLENKTQMNRDPSKDTSKIVETGSVSELAQNFVGNRMTPRRSSRMINKVNKLQKTDSESSDYSDVLDDNCIIKCSRTNAYEGRKFSNGYYKNMNNKILEMEKNDKRLQERLAILNNKTSEENTVIKPATEKTTKDTTSFLELLCDVNEIFPSPKSSDEDIIPKSKTKRLSSETKLVAWLESNYKTYKQRNDQGHFKTSLEPPKFGKVALHAWDFILNRYRERKNLFLVSQQKPYRIFMAVNTKNPFFENCTNINDIRFADLHKYPQTVRNLLINATHLKDNFCILRGLTCCWEIIGSVTKVSESDEQSGEHEETPEINVESSNNDSFVVFNQNVTLDDNLLVEKTDQKDVESHCITEEVLDSNTASPEDAGSSKWFVMTIENDFSEIRFFRKGFFVKLESIINAINVARLSGKTVRLSSKKCIEQCEIPQFGIYAIPNDNEYCVFVGPYEMEDTLGIETIKTILDVRKLKKTRGFWITTNKVDNLKVVENPLSFVPLNNPQNDKAMPLETHFSANDDINKNQKDKPERESPSNKTEGLNQECSPTSPSKKEIKIVKPIKIRKTNGFYHLAPDGVLKKVALQCPQNISKAMPVVFNTYLTVDGDVKNSLLKPVTVSNNVNTNLIHETPQEPIAEAASQIKITSVYSTQDDDSLPRSAKHEGGMFILKPEEINRKLFKKKTISEPTTTATDVMDINEANSSISSMELGVESSSITSTEWSTPKDVIYVISDDENDTTIESTQNCHIWRDVWIECTNTSNLGWIPGIKNLDNLLSFKFPGCEYSEFFTEEEVFTKINSEIFKRIGTSMNSEWKVTESGEELQGQEMNIENLFPDNVETEETCT